MSCDEPTPPGPGASSGEKLKYLKLLAEYIRCVVAENSVHAHAGLCDDLDDLEAAIDDVYDGTTPADSTTPLTGLSTLAGQYVAQLSIAAGPPIDQAYLAWGKVHMSEYRTAAGC